MANSTQSMRTPKIQLLQSTSTGLAVGWEAIRTIEILAEPFGSGAFGEVFDCLTVDDKPPLQPLVIKVLTPDANDNHLHGYETIRKLQARVRAKSQAIAAVPGLYALPQFSFTGKLQNRTVLGYAAYKLDPARFSTMEEILQNRFRDFRTLTFGKKLHLALDLTACFECLRELNYIHADINPHNLLINLTDSFYSHERHLVLIDYDSGVVVDQPTDTPTTYGKKNEWLAPEVYEQESRLSNGKCNVTVDLFTDIWAVAVGVHYLLFSRFPFFFLKVAGPQELRAYLKKYRWPEVDKDYPNFNPTQTRIYDDYRKRFDRISGDLKRPFILTFNEGVYNRTRRVSYNQWTLLLKRVLDRRRSIKNGLLFIVLLLVVVVPFFRTTPPHSLPHQRTAEADAEYAQSDLDMAERALARGDRTAAERALATAGSWDAARAAQFRRMHAAALQASLPQGTSTQEAPLSAALTAAQRWEALQAKQTSAGYPSSPQAGERFQDHVSGMEFVYLKGGCFSMGSPTTEGGRQANEGLWGRHSVCLGAGFWIATTEATNAQYRQFYPNHRSGHSHGFSLEGENQPVVNVTWWDVMHYTEALNQEAKHLGLSQQYRLPSEAQWEYAARAGTTTRYFWGADTDDSCHYANTETEKHTRTHAERKDTHKATSNKAQANACPRPYEVTAPVGSLAPNPWGLYDLLGNVWEWTCSVYHDSYDGAEQACATQAPDEPRTMRGGSWQEPISSLRVAERRAGAPDSKSNSLGFRLIMEF